MITISVKEKDILYCDDVNNFTFKANEEKKEIEVYKNGILLGSIGSVVGMSVDELITHIIH